MHRKSAVMPLPPSTSTLNIIELRTKPVAIRQILDIIKKYIPKDVCIGGEYSKHCSIEIWHWIP